MTVSFICKSLFHDIPIGFASGDVCSCTKMNNFCFAYYTLTYLYGKYVRKDFVMGKISTKTYPEKEALLDSETRKALAGRIEVLDRVKALVLMP